MVFCLFAQDEKTEGIQFPKLDSSPMDAAYFPPRAAFRAFMKTEEEQKANIPLIKVLYSRPQKKGREIFGAMLPYGKAWRVGANESSEIEFYKNVKIGGQLVPAGIYTFCIFPSENTWKIAFNVERDGWGAYAYDPAKDIASTTAKVEDTGKEVEALSILFEKGEEGMAEMIVAWDRSMIRVPIEIM